MDLSGSNAEVHIRTDANNLVTTAKTTHLPEQKETIHMIQQLRHEACSGEIKDLAHVATEDCLADALTKTSAKQKALIEAVNSGILPNLDKHPPFREIMAGRHKAYATIGAWIVKHIDYGAYVETFLDIPVQADIQRCLLLQDWHAEEDGRFS